MEEIKDAELTLNINKDITNVSGKINKFIVVPRFLDRLLENLRLIICI